MNEWNNAAKLLRLKVQLTGRTQMAFQRFPYVTKETFVTANEALEKGFEPPSRQDWYQA